MANSFQQVKTNSNASASNLYLESSKQITAGLDNAVATLTGLHSDVKNQEAVAAEKRFTDFALEVSKVNTLEDAAILKDKLNSVDLKNAFGSDAFKAGQLLTTLDKQVRDKQYNKNQDLLRASTQQDALADNQYKGAIAKAQELYNAGDLTGAKRIAADIKSPSGEALRNTLATAEKEKTIKRNKAFVAEALFSGQNTGNINGSMTTLDNLLSDPNLDPDVRKEVYDAKFQLTTLDRTPTTSEAAALSEGERLIGLEANTVGAELAKVSTDLSKITAELDAFNSSEPVAADDLTTFTKLSEQFGYTPEDSRAIVGNIISAAEKVKFNEIGVMGRPITMKDITAILSRAPNDVDNWLDQSTVESSVKTHMNDIKQTQANKEKLLAKQSEFLTKRQTIDVALSQFKSEYMQQLTTDGKTSLAAVDIHKNPSFLAAHKAALEVVYGKPESKTSPTSVVQKEKDLTEIAAKAKPVSKPVEKAVETPAVEKPDTPVSTLVPNKRSLVDIGENKEIMDLYAVLDRAGKGDVLASALSKGSPVSSKEIARALGNADPFTFTYDSLSSDVSNLLKSSIKTGIKKSDIPDALKNLTKDSSLEEIKAAVSRLK